MFFGSLDFSNLGFLLQHFHLRVIFSIKGHPYLGHNFRGHRVKNKYTESTLLNKGFNIILLQVQNLIAQFSVYPLCITIATVLLKSHIGRNSLV